MAEAKFFSNGSYVVHGITLVGYKGRFSVWCDAAGNMTDCERADIRGGRAVARNASMLRGALEKVAKRYGNPAK